MRNESTLHLADEVFNCSCGAFLLFFNPLAAGKLGHREVKVEGVNLTREEPSVSVSHLLHPVRLRSCRGLPVDEIQLGLCVLE